MLGHEDERDDAALREVHEQFVHVKDEESLLRHGIHVAVQRIDDHHLGAAAFDFSPDEINKFAGRDFCGIELADGDFFLFDQPA